MSSWNFNLLPSLFRFLKQRSRNNNRRGITLIELLCSLLFLVAALGVFSRPSYRAVEIARIASGDMRYDSLVAVVAFILTLFVWLCVVVGIYRLRLRYGDLLYFPMMVGLPLGFAAVPFRPFSLPVYVPLLAVSVVATSLALFLLQSAIILL